jgi:EmrB/QacA subfamily drug resistance transporter
MDPSPERSPDATRVLALAAGVSAASALDTSLMFIAYPEIAEAFSGASPAELSWVLTSYTIVAAALLVPAGRLADRVGRRRVFLTGSGLFTLGAGLSAAAPVVGVLVAARVVQAVGGAMLTPSALALIMHEYPPGKRASAVGAWAAISGVSASAAPVVGAAAIEVGSWRFAFLIPVPIGIVALTLGPRVLRESRDDSSGAGWDPLGSVLVVAGIAALAYAIVQSGDWGWLHPRTIGVLVAAVGVLAFFVARCAHHPAPVVDLRLFARRSFRVTVVVGFTVGLAYFCMFFALVQFVTLAWDGSILEAGLLTVPIPLVSGCTALMGGRIADRVGHRRVMVPGGLAFAAGAAWLLLTAGDEPALLVTWFPALVVMGAGIGVLLPSCNSAGAFGMEPHELGTSAGVVQTVIRVGGALGTAIGILAVSDIAAGDGADEFDAVWSLLVGAGLLTAAVASLLDTRPRAAPVDLPTDPARDGAAA